MLAIDSGPVDVPILDETIGTNLARTVAVHGANQALVSAHQQIRWTYAELAERVETLACGLLGLGLEKGDRLGLWSPNHAEWTLLQYATAEIGVILVNVNPAYRSYELAYVLDQSGCRVLVGPRVQDQRLPGDGGRGARRGGPLSSGRSSCGRPIGRTSSSTPPAPRPARSTSGGPGWAPTTRIDGDGWMHTGDLAVMDEDGYINIVGRSKDMVIRGGENIYPREIEEFLYTHPAVLDVQVVGVPDAKYGEQLLAAIRLQPGASATEDEIREFCRDTIAHYKVPAYVRFVDEFPMTVTGKVQKYKLPRTGHRGPRPPVGCRYRHGLDRVGHLR